MVITRIFNAPGELVFKVWTGPKHVAQWWGLKGFTTQVTKLDLRPGGKWCYSGLEEELDSSAHEGSRCGDGKSFWIEP
ncbi:SRPBCC domain-containing protein [Trichocoleus sp. DQ-U1]|uniref:SRPBCC domain-containing protein n=1 Tax=Trichocoleus sp. DQ-U1 TaxID=2933926 RepID=UPI003299EF7F